jgi:outer membrane receptor protein involved in Fe transport
MSDWNLFGEVLAMSERVAGNDFTGQFSGLAGYGIGNIHVRYDNDMFNFSAGVNNILDKQYRESGAVNFLGQTGYFPAPERNYMISIGYNF